MASALQLLRKHAGYKNADEFAKVVDIVPSTYKRYEQLPEKIPTTVAWKIADELGVSIDVIVGRKTMGDENSLDAVFSLLTKADKKLLLTFIDFLVAKEEKEADIKEEKRNRQYEEFARYYERMFMDSSFGGDLEADIAFATPSQYREMLEDFIRAKAKTKRESEAAEYEENEISSMLTSEPLYENDETGMEVFVGYNEPQEVNQVIHEAALNKTKYLERKEEEDERTIQRIMEAYDRIHPELEGDITYSIISLSEE